MEQTSLIYLQASLTIDIVALLHFTSSHFVCRTFQIPFIRGAAFADNLEFLREILKTLHKCARCTHCRARTPTLATPYFGDVQAVIREARSPSCSRQQKDCSQSVESLGSAPVSAFLRLSCIFTAL